MSHQNQQNDDHGREDLHNMITTTTPTTTATAATTEQMMANNTTNHRTNASKHSIKNIYDLSRFESSTRSGSGSTTSGGQHVSSACLTVCTDPIKRMASKIRRSIRERDKCGEWVKKRVPIVGWLPKYKPKRYLLPDAMAGLTVGIMNIPQGLAYALLATLNPIYGLYVSFFPIIVYTMFGTCRHLIVGGVAIVSLLTGSVIDQMVVEHFNNATNTTESHFRVEIACQLSLLVGLIQFVMGFVGLGFISSYFSDTFISGYTCASAIHVVMSQLKDLFGLKKLTKYNGIFKIPKMFVEFLAKIHTSNWITFGFSLGCMIFLIICKEITNPMIKKRFHFEFPSELVLIITMTTVSYFANLKQNFNISIIENIPTGLPNPAFPSTTYLVELLKNALLIATISFSVSISLSSLFSRKKKYKIDPTQELYALGLSGMVGSVFSCYPIAGSLSRTSVVSEIGGKTQIASLFSTSVLIIVILWLAPFLKTLPNLCLASVIVVALKGLLFQICDLPKLWRVNKFEFITWLVTFLSVVVLDVDWGLFIGVAVSILTVIWRDQMTPLRTLSNTTITSSLFREDFVSTTENTNIDERLHIVDREIKVYRIEHSIYFANCKTFAENIYKLNRLKPSTHVKKSVLHQQHQQHHHDLCVNKIDKDEEEVTNDDTTDDLEEENRLRRDMDQSETSATNEVEEENQDRLRNRHTIMGDTTIVKANSRKRQNTRSTTVSSTGNNHHNNNNNVNIMIDVENGVRSMAEDFILDFSAVNYIDTNGIQIVEELVEDFKQLGAFVYICGPQECFLKMICRLNLIDKFDAHVFLTVDDAVRHFNKKI